jgi:hypothetical protein
MPCCICCTYSFPPICSHAHNPNSSHQIYMLHSLLQRYILVLMKLGSPKYYYLSHASGISNSESQLQASSLCFHERKPGARQFLYNCIFALDPVELYHTRTFVTSFFSGELYHTRTSLNPNTRKDPQSERNSFNTFLNVNFVDIEYLSFLDIFFCHLFIKHICLSV